MCVCVCVCACVCVCVCACIGGVHTQSKHLLLSVVAVKSKFMIHAIIEYVLLFIIIIIIMRFMGG